LSDGRGEGESGKFMEACGVNGASGTTEGDDEDEGEGDPASGRGDIAGDS
jgi:hypothetical protein